MGLKTCHRCSAVVKKKKDKVGLAVNPVDQGRDRGMEKSRITARGQDRLFKPELLQLAQAIGHTNTRAHAVHRLELLESG